MVKLAIAVDLGASHIRVALGDNKGKIITKIKETTVTVGSISQQILRMVKLILATNNKKIQGMGVGTVGPLDTKRNMVINSANLTVSEVRFNDLKQLGLPIYLLNDANAAAFGEKHFGLGKNVDNLVYITLSSGIGTGAIVDGHLLSGKEENAAEMGHAIVDTTYNLPCGCQKGVGHWESLASGRNIPRFFKKWLGQRKVDFKVTTENIFAEANNGNKLVLSFIEELGKINSRGIYNLIRAYGPELITIGGSVAVNNKKLILEPILRNIPQFKKLPEIKITQLGDDIGLLGALAAVFNKVGTLI
ncbi:MAG: ROK family protein [Candidatus Woesearchaeota archaeon]